MIDIETLTVLRPAIIAIYTKDGELRKRVCDTPDEAEAIRGGEGVKCMVLQGITIEVPATDAQKKFAEMLNGLSEAQTLTWLTAQLEDAEFTDPR